MTEKETAAKATAAKKTTARTTTAKTEAAADAEKTSTAKTAAAKVAPATTKAKEIAYTLVGLGVMGVQKVTAKGTEFMAKSPVDVDASVTKAKGAASAVKVSAKRTATKVDAVVESSVTRMEAAVAPLEAKLPNPVRDGVSKAHDSARELRSQVRTKVLA